jgi:predicted ATP-binding protein involved in virulence
MEIKRTAMHRIKELRLHEVGPFRDVTIPFPAKPKDSKKAELHLFTGQNGTGKTTLLYAVANLLDWQAGQGQWLQPRFATEEAFVRVDIDDFHFFYLRHQGEARVPGFLPIEHPNAYHQVFDHPWGCVVCKKHDLAFYAELTKDYQTRASFRPNASPGKTEFSWALFGYSGSRILEYQPLQAIQEINTSPFQNALFAPQRTQDQLVQWIANLESKSALYRQKGEIATADGIVTTLRAIEKAVSDIIGKAVRFSLDIDPLKVFFEVDGVSLTFDLLPEGLKSIISWMADLLMRLDRIPWHGDIPVLERPFFLFLDEVDVHLHPAWQRKVLSVAQGLFPNACIFATTHSPFVVGSIDEGTIYRLDLDDAGNASLYSTHSAEPGKSIELILDEVFGVREQFDDATESKLEELRELRERVLESKGKDALDEWNALSDKLDLLGLEVASIAARERRQVERLLGNS